MYPYSTRKQAFDKDEAVVCEYSLSDDYFNDLSFYDEAEPCGGEQDDLVIEAYPGRGERRHGRHEGKPPARKPPEFVPERGKSVKAVDPGSIRRCTGGMAYIWLRNGKSAWMYITHVGRKSLSGYSWTHYGWVYTGFDLRMIESFYCY